MQNYFSKVVFIVAATTEKILSIGNSNEGDKHQNFSDGLGLYNVSGKVMSKEEIEAEEYETGLYDDY
ncbi:hypothetical protein CTT31_18130 [Pseudoalteromonas maricaloris]|uniref:hypothetical protein n=1 Tax=Pseudoalteromonas maricaloris TaxID=184924 RepID=UPI0021AD7ECB|nr:hypothetical protein [Pseudoalteromonas flavipulchra]USE70938.1 hypothetical protein CTT31_18130 [Pseudoalteromonas flavipulchra]